MIQILMMSGFLMVLTYISHRFFADAVDKFLFTEDPRTLSDYAYFSMYVVCVIAAIFVFVSLIHTSAKKLKQKLDDVTY